MACSAALVNTCGVHGPRSTTKLNNKQQACSVSETHLDTGRLKAALVFYAMNSTFVFEPILNNYKSKGFNQGPSVWSNICVSVFMCVYTDEGHASKWIGISQRSSNGNIWSLSSLLICCTPGHTTVAPANACTLTDIHNHVQIQCLCVTLSLCGDKNGTICLSITHNFNVWNMLSLQQARTTCYSLPK